MPGHQEFWGGGLPALSELHCFGMEKVIRAKNLLGLSQRHARCLCSVKKTERAKHYSLERDLHGG